MHRLSVTIAAVALSAAVAVSALAQDAGNTFIGAQTTDQYLAKDQLIGAKVHNADGKIIGDVEDLIINEWNQVVGVVMGTGGVLGLGEKKIGVRLGALKFDEANGKTVVTLSDGTQAALDAAPAYERVKPKKTLLERAKEKAQELSDKTKATTQKTIDSAKPKLEEAKEKAVEAYEKAKEAAQPAIDQAKEAAEEAKKAVKEAVDAAKEAVEEVAPAEGPPATEPAPSTNSAEPSPPAETPPAPQAEPTPAPAPAP